MRDMVMDLHNALLEGRHGQKLTDWALLIDRLANDIDDAS